MFNFYIIDCAGPHVSPGNLTIGPCQRFQQRQIKRPLIRALETQRHRHFHHDLHLYGNFNLENSLSFFKKRNGIHIRSGVQHNR